MIVIGNKENRILVLIITLLILLLIGFVDSKTNQELSFSIFYIIPITLLALVRGTRKSAVIICSLAAAILWLLAEYNNKEFSHLFFLYWSAFVRLSFFLAISLLVLYLKDEVKKLHIANQRLKELNEDKNKFIGIAAHDLRNPISGIFLLTDLLMDDYKDHVHSEVLEGMTIIRKLSKNTLSVLENLLDISVIESGKIELNTIYSDYIQFVKEQISYNQILSKHKSIFIYFQPATGSIYTLFDPHYMGEVIDNLLSNAIKYSSSGTEIAVRVALKDNQTILTEVIDKGKGIPEKEQDKLFNYFQKTSVRPEGGETSTGLGLAIVRHIVNMHHGEISVKSIAGQGSNFYFTLPVLGEESLSK
jgi:signal transduction histidine kinase